jgi:hypothetical protein
LEGAKIGEKGQKAMMESEWEERKRNIKPLRSLRELRRKNIVIPFLFSAKPHKAQSFFNS